MIKMLQVEKVGAHAAFWENSWAWSKSSLNRLVRKEDYVGLGLPTDSFIGQGRIGLSLKIPSQYETYT